MFMPMKGHIAGLGAMLFAAGLALAAPGQAGNLTITDAYSSDLPVQVKCPGGQIETITDSQPVFCTVQAGNVVTLTNQAGVSCMARIAVGGAVDKKKSTCVSGNYAPGTLALTANQGVYPGVLWTLIDGYSGDWGNGGVAVMCPNGVVRTIGSSSPVSCAIPANGALKFKVGGNVACTANFDKNSNYLPATSTCKPASYSGNTMVFPSSQGVYPSVLWTFVDADNSDWPVAVACPNNVTQTIDSSSSVNCAVTANGQVQFSVGGKLACTANFDANSNYLPASSTCKPAASSGNTLAFSASQGVVPPIAPNRIVDIGFAGGGAAVSCASGTCGTVSSQQVVLPGPLNQNGAMTLGFATGSGTAQVSCNVSFYNNFIDDRQTTCQGVTLVAPSGPGTAYQLTFPSTTVGKSTVGELLVYPPAPASAPTGTQVGSRTLTFVNKCSQPVWYGLVSGTVGPKPGAGEHGNAKASGNLCAGAPAGKNVTCPYGTSCRYVNSSQAYCFYNPADPAMPANGNRLQQYMLAAASSSSPTSGSVTIPIYRENAVVFSGGASARLGCQDAAGNPTQCAVGNCNDDKNALGCGYTNGTGNGATIAEFTLQAQAMDYYDISIINGAHVPMSMAPTAGQTPDPTQKGSTVGYYWCGAPGSANKTAASGQPVCDWNLAAHLTGAQGVPQAKAKYFVGVTAPKITAAQRDGKGNIDVSKLNYCASDADCAGQRSCGLSLDLLSQLAAAKRSGLFSAAGANGKAGPYTCGKKLGYSTPVDICALVTSGDDGFLHCNTLLTQTAPGAVAVKVGKKVKKAHKTVSLSYANLYSCNGPTDNCVKPKSDYTNSVCCGCSTWQKIAGVVSGMAAACTYNGSGTNSNTAWDGSGAGPDVKGKIGFLKQACPSAYAYQFDDATSTFNCYVDGTGAAAAYNATNYTITFCPAGTALQ